MLSPKGAGKRYFIVKATSQCYTADVLLTALQKMTGILYAHCAEVLIGALAHYGSKSPEKMEFTHGCYTCQLLQTDGTGKVAVYIINAPVNAAAQLLTGGDRGRQ